LSQKNERECARGLDDKREIKDGVGERKEIVGRSLGMRQKTSRKGQPKNNVERRDQVRDHLREENEG